METFARTQTGYWKTLCINYLTSVVHISVSMDCPNFMARLKLWNTDCWPLLIHIWISPSSAIPLLLSISWMKSENPWTLVIWTAKSILSSQWERLMFRKSSKWFFPHRFTLLTSLLNCLFHWSKCVV